MILLSTAYLPPISYFYFLAKHHQCSIEAYENYPKQTYRNRCYIYTGNGKHMLSVPVIKVNGNHTLCKDIQIDYITPWTKQHIRSIESAYKNSPYYDYYAEDILHEISSEHKSLIELNTILTKLIAKQIGLNVQISKTQTFVHNACTSKDYRYRITPKLNSIIKTPRYLQTFEERFGFLHDLSIIDLLFHLGPDSKLYLEQIPE